MMPRLIVVVIVVDAVLLAAAPVHAQELDEITLEDIWGAFRAREEQVESAQVTWKYRYMMSEYSVAGALEGEREDPSQASDVVFPEKTCRLSLAGERVRFESPIAVFDHGQGGRPTPSISAFDGVDDQGLITSLRDDVAHSGSLEQTDAWSQWNMIHLQALTCALRPLRAELFGPERGEWRILDDPAVIEGRQCVVLELAHPIERDSDSVYLEADRAYLDPEHGFRLVRRNNIMNNGQVGFQVDVRYEEGDSPDWFPTNWNVASYGFVTGKLIDSSENRLVSVVLNEPIPGSEFQIRFPPGAHVRRIFTPYESQMYVAQRDGQLVPASPRRSLLAPAAAEPWWRRSWGLTACGTVLLLLAVVWGERWRRNHVSKNGALPGVPDH